MKSIPKLLLLLITALLFSSCGAIPTLPPLDSTVTIRTPQFTTIPPDVSATPKVSITTEESPPVEATETATIIPHSPTSTLLPASPTPENTLTPMPIASLTATATSTPQPTFTATPMPYTLQVMNPYYLSNFTHQDLGCNWMGVAGQIFSSGGQVQMDILIKAGGDINGTPVLEDMTMPLTEPETDLAYGPGGYELTISSSLADTDSTAWVQLFNLEGDPLSEKVFLITYDDCQKNLILMNFIEH